jgi:hypothetical protein
VHSVCKCRLKSALRRTGVCTRSDARNAGNAGIERDLAPRGSSETLYGAAGGSNRSGRLLQAKDGCRHIFAGTLLCFSQQSLVRGGERTALVQGKRNVKAIIGWMIEFDGKFCCAMELRAHGDKLHIGPLKKLRRGRRFGGRQLAKPVLLPEDVCALRDNEIGRSQPCFSQRQGFRRAGFLNDPFDSDARVNDEICHRSSRPSQRSSSEGVCSLAAVSLRS